MISKTGDMSKGVRGAFMAEANSKLLWRVPAFKFAAQKAKNRIAAVF